MIADTLCEIRKLLRLRMNGEVSTSMRKRGLDYKINFGLDAISIKEIANRYIPDALLAEALWIESSREGKILATLLYPKNEFSSQKADEWIVGCFTTELAEQLCFNLLQHLDFAAGKSIEWIMSSDDNTKSHGYLLMLRLLLSKKELPDLSMVLESSEKDMQSSHFQLRQQATRLHDRCFF